MLEKFSENSDTEIAWENVMDELGLNEDEVES